jgi:hypothetical protein
MRDLDDKEKQALAAAGSTAAGAFAAAGNGAKIAAARGVLATLWLGKNIGGIALAVSLVVGVGLTVWGAEVMKTQAREAEESRQVRERWRAEDEKKRPEREAGERREAASELEMVAFKARLDVQLMGSEIRLMGSELTLHLAMFGTRGQPEQAAAEQAYTEQAAIAADIDAAFTLVVAASDAAKKATPGAEWEAAMENLTTLVATTVELKATAERMVAANDKRMAAFATEREAAALAAALDAAKKRLAQRVR